MLIEFGLFHFILKKNNKLMNATTGNSKFAQKWLTVVQLMFFANYLFCAVRHWFCKQCHFCTNFQNVMYNITNDLNTRYELF
ncbi:hypothetical protein A5893_17235 [Pedobacter psychrophilus]|uniref:Uncharacterized protein n=1 Tax=Pedobacter psychrophilus TaxID=1826909 RepID=A0A179DRC3_9SPHI|nr:hypothetical protein A5893_17235 [Pedobacter psychrophilus]